MIKNKKKTHKFLKPELLDGFCKWFTILAFSCLGLLLLSAIVSYFVSGRVIFKILEHLADIGAFGFLGCAVMYLLLIPIIMIFYIILKRKKTTYHFRWLPISFIIFAFAFSLTTCILHHEVSYNSCMDWCVGPNGEYEEECSFSTCDFPVIW